MSHAAVVGTNVLINAIPFNYDTAGSYSIIVTDACDNTHSPIASNGSTPWYFDGNSGYLTFFVY